MRIIFHQSRLPSLPNPESGKILHIERPFRENIPHHHHHRPHLFLPPPPQIYLQRHIKLDLHLHHYLLNQTSEQQSPSKAKTRLNHRNHVPRALAPRAPTPQPAPLLGRARARFGFSGVVETSLPPSLLSLWLEQTYLSRPCHRKSLGKWSVDLDGRWVRWVRLLIFFFAREVL